MNEEDEMTEETVEYNSTRYCPEQDRRSCVQVTMRRAKPGLAACRKTSYEPISYKCAYAEKYGCRSCGPDGNQCPVFINVGWMVR